MKPEDPGLPPRQARQERLRAALRANLRKRRRQSQERPEADARTTGGDENPGIGD
ncbi:hypothetical protein [Thermaurantiacus sp.]